MTHDASDDFDGIDEKRSAGSGDVSVEELTWGLVDDQLDSGEFELLESMLLSDDKARTTYVDCIQLHVDLMAHYAKPAEGAAAGKSPILSFLGGAVPPFDVRTST